MGTCSFASLEISSEADSHQLNGDKQSQLERPLLTWTPLSGDGLTFTQANRNSIEAIGNSTSVLIYASPNGHALCLEADTESAICSAKSKLEALDSSSQRKPESYNFSVPEGTLSAKLALARLKDLDDLATQTLLDKNSSQIRSLWNHYVIVLMEDGEVVCRKRTPRTESEKYLWKNHPLSLEENARPNISNKKEHTVGEWAKETSAVPVLNPFEPNDSTKKQQAKKTRIPRSANLTTERSNSEEAASNAALSLTSGHTGGSASKKGSVLTNGHVTTQFRLPPIKPPFNPSPARDSIDGIEEYSEPSIANYDWGPRNRIRKRNDLLIDVDDQAPYQSESKEILREKHETMNQRKPSAKPGNTALLEASRKSILAILATSRGCIGRLELKVLIGRHLLDHKTIPAEFQTQVFEPSHWQNLFQPRRGNPPQTKFLKRVSSSYHDIASILRLKIARGRMLFDPDSVAESVTYVLNCRSSTYERVIFEIDEMKGFKIRGVTEFQGAVNWYFVSRTWDSRKLLHPPWQRLALDLLSRRR